MKRLGQQQRLFCYSSRGLHPSQPFGTANRQILKLMQDADTDWEALFARVFFACISYHREGGFSSQFDCLLLHFPQRWKHPSPDVCECIEFPMQHLTIEYIEGTKLKSESNIKTHISSGLCSAKVITKDIYGKNGYNQVLVNSINI